MYSALKKITLKTIITLFVALLVFIPILHAQQPNRLSGKIIDAETGSPVVSATIIVNTSGKGYKSDVEGTFFLPAEKGKTITLKVSSVGYAEKKSDLTAKQAGSFS